MTNGDSRRHGPEGKPPLWRLCAVKALHSFIFVGNPLGNSLWSERPIAVRRISAEKGAQAPSKLRTYRAPERAFNELRPRATNTRARGPLRARLLPGSQVRSSSRPSTGSAGNHGLRIHKAASAAGAYP